MEREFKVRKPTNVEKEKYTYIERDEKDIPLGTFEPVEILEYRGYDIPIYGDDYSQEFFIRFNDAEWANPNCYYEDFCDFIDSKLDYLVANRPIQILHKELSELSYEILKLVRKTDMGDMLYLKYKSLEKDIHKWLKLTSELLRVPSHVYKDLLELDPIVKEQIERLALREMYNDVALVKDKGE